MDRKISLVMRFRKTTTTLPLKCPDPDCKYFGNAAINNCPVCGTELEHFRLEATRILNRVNNLEYLRDHTNMSIIVGRQKYLVKQACDQLLDVDPEITDELGI